SVRRPSRVRSGLSGNESWRNPAVSASRQVSASRAGSGKPKRLVPKVSGAVTRGRSDGILRALRVRPIHVEELPARRVHAFVGVGAEVVPLRLEQIGGQ